TKPEKGQDMRAFDTASSRDFLVCPMCEAGRLGTFGGNSVRCNSYGCLLNMAVPETLREIVHLPDALLGSHACECGYPEMRLLPYGIYRCPACGAEVLPVEETSLRREAEEECWSCR
ncbi:MAG: hypothetical protein LC781_21910, partial [Actinobacteria bacterium]|nr:hypothetical protein [Actinomycetota bacterium]